MAQKSRVGIKDELENMLAFQMKAYGIHAEREVLFAKESLNRKWRADFKIGNLLIEVEGGIWVNGRHTRGKGFINDCEKYAEALCLGYRGLRIPGPWVKSGKGIDYIRRAIK